MKKVRDLLNLTSMRFRLSAAGSAALIFQLFFPSSPWPGLATFGFVLFCIIMRSARIKDGALLGFVFGFLFFGGLSLGLPTAIRAQLSLGWARAGFLWILFCAINATPYALFGLINGIANNRGRPLNFAARAVVLTALQIAFDGLAPITPVNCLYLHPLLIQTLDIGGVPLLLLIYNLAVWLGIDVARSLSERKKMLSLLSVEIVLFAAVVIYGVLRLHIYQNEPGAKLENSIRIAAIQPNLPIKTRGESLFVDAADADNDLSTVVSLSEKAIRDFPDLELIVWPELPIVVPCLGDDSLSDQKDAARKIADFVRRHQTRLVYACERDVTDKEGPKFHNAAVLVSREIKASPIYAKRILVPFAEYLPGERTFPGLRRFFPGARNYISGDMPTVFEITGEIKAIPAICYELMFSSHVRDFAAAGGNVIVNMSDEAYFGRTAASSIAVSAGVFRSVEYRMPMVRAANAGNSCFAASTGEIVDGFRAPLFQKAVLTAPLSITHGDQSFCLRFGHNLKWVIYLLFIIYLVQIACLIKKSTK